MVVLSLSLKNATYLFVLLLVGVAVFGFYRGWFQVSTDTANQKPNATISVDKDKFHADEQKAKDKVQGLGQGAKEKLGDGTGNSQAPERRP
jgi:hypothetical protein